jgi:hypothetical protein
LLAFVVLAVVLVLSFVFVALVAVLAALVVSFDVSFLNAEVTVFQAFLILLTAFPRNALIPPANAVPLAKAVPLDKAFPLRLPVVILPFSKICFVCSALNIMSSFL